MHAASLSLVERNRKRMALPEMSGRPHTRYRTPTAQPALQVWQWTRTRECSSAELFLERLPHFRARAVEEHALVRLAELEQPADIACFPALDVTEDDHLALLR